MWLSASVAAALSYVLPSDEAMVDGTSTIVYGRVLSGAPAPDDLRLPATDFTLRVEEVLKGSVQGDTVVVRQLGGSHPDGLAMRVGGLPMLQEGERVLLFLREREQVYRTMDFALGIFFETKLADRTLLEREPSLRHDVLAMADDVAGRGEQILGPRDGAAFRRWIRERAAGVEKPADYFVPESDIVRGPESVVSPYRFMRTEAYCTYDDWSMRWTEFEQGQSVNFRLQRGGQPGFSWNATLRAVNDAMWAWNSDSRSRVDLRYFRDPFRLEVGEPRVQNLIMFDDPFAGGNAKPIGRNGGAIAWAGVSYQCYEAPISRPPDTPYSRFSDVRISRVEITTAKGLGDFLRHRSTNESEAQRVFSITVAHELGHSLGIAHPCGDNASGACTTRATEESLMNPKRSWHVRAYGPVLTSDDQAILRRLYAKPGNADLGDNDDGSRGGPPTASFTLSASCVDGLCRARTGMSVSFTDTSTGTVAARTWSFGDGGAGSRSRSPRHAWSAPGFYTVSLTVSGEGGLSTVSRKVLVEAGDPAGSCTVNGDTRCLRESRFSVAVEWWPEDGEARRAGKVVHEGTDDSGLFWFFSEANWELLLKVLDGCSLNGHVWVFGASATTLGYSIRVTDTLTGAMKEYRNEPGNRSSAIADTAAFPDACAGTGAGAGAAASAPPVGNDAVVAAPSAAGSGSCLPAAGTLCLQGGRYTVSVDWTNREGDTGNGSVAPPRTDDSGLFWFFSEANWELLVKVLDACTSNGHHWVFAASATDVGFDLQLRDTMTGRIRQYTKEPGKPGRALVDVSAFPEGCQPP